MSERQLALRSAVLVGLLLVTRIWVLGHPIPVHGDEVGFLHGLGFPSPYPVHHPGYPLWIALGTTAWRLGASSYGAFVIWSVTGSVIAPWLLYRGLRWMVSDGLAWWAALTFGLNPLMWFLSTTALNYTVGVAVGLVIVGCTWRGVVSGEARWLHRASWAMAVCIWLRPDYLLWLGPILLAGMWRTRRGGGWKGLGLVLASAAGLVGVAFVLYGRGEIERRPVGQFSYWLEVLFQTSVFRLGLMDGLVRSGAKLAGILVWVFGAASLLLLVGGVRLAAIGRRHPGTIRFLIWWTLPLVLFVLMIHMSEPGHVILLVPAGYVLIALGLSRFMEQGQAVRLMSGLAICSAVQFLAWPWSVESTGWKRVVDAKIGYLSASGLRKIDHRWDIHRPSDIWPTAVHQPTATRPVLESQPAR